MKEEIKQKTIADRDSIILYTDEENNIEVEVVLRNEDVWINVESLAKLFQIDRTGIARHINHIYQEEELYEDSTCAKIAHVGNNGKQQYYTNYYNLDMMIAIGFRVNSKSAIKFRAWANKMMKESMSKSFALDDNALMKSGRFPVWTRWWECMKKKIKEWIKNRRKE